MNEEVLIKTENLWHIYQGGVVALRNVNLEIHKGDVIAVIGQNGSGKTTLVKHFNGLLKPTRGRVLVKGVDTTKVDVSDLSRYVGYSFQNPSHQIFNSTVEREIEFGVRNLGLSEDEVRKRVEEALRFFGLDKYRAAHPYRLTFPLRKLVAIASIYAMSPEVIVLDEPTTALDHIGVRLIQDLVIRLRKRNYTVVVVTHDMRFVAETTERVIVLSDGQVLMDATPREVFSNYEVMNKTALHPPQIAELSNRLRHPDIPKPSLTVEELGLHLSKLL